MFGFRYYLDSTQGGGAAGPAGDHEEPGGAAAGDDDSAGAAANGAAAQAPQRQRLDPEELLREAEEAAGDGGVQVVDSKGLKRLLLALERKVGSPVLYCSVPHGCTRQRGKVG